MRKAFLSWSVGLLCIGSLAGCGLMQRNRDGCCDKGCATGDSKCATSGSAYSTSTARTRPGLIGPAKKDESTKSASTPPPLEMPPKVLPDPKNITQPKPMPRDTSGEERNHFEVLPLPPEPVAKTEPITPLLKSAANVTPEPPMGPSPNVRTSAKEQLISESANTGEKNIAVKTTNITYGQVGNYKEVTGQVTLYRKTFRLRYASVAMEDRYGGVVVLEGGAELNQLRDQCHVRVRGELIPPEDRTSPARYRVKSIEILD